MTITREHWHEVFPDKPPGVYSHVTDGSPCWCRPVRMGNVVIHRSWEECKAEIEADLVKRAKRA
jgi:hypothetical protein